MVYRRQTRPPWTYSIIHVFIYQTFSEHHYICTNNSFRYCVEYLIIQKIAPVLQHLKIYLVIYTLLNTANMYRIPNMYQIVKSFQSQLRWFGFNHTGNGEHWKICGQVNITVKVMLTKMYLMVVPRKDQREGNCR